MGMFTFLLWVHCSIFDVVKENTEVQRVAQNLDGQYLKSGEHGVQFVIPDSLPGKKLLKDPSSADFSMKIGDSQVAVGKEGF